MGMTVTFGVIAYNEEKYLPDLLLDIQKQTYPRDLMEIILVDGGSTDFTWQIMEKFAFSHKNEYRNVKVLKNPKRIQPAGWNVVIQNSTSDILLRVDAHARLPEDFVEKNVDCLRTGEYVCGGPRVNIIDQDTPWKRMLLVAEQSLFGAGAASYRRGTGKKKYVKSVFHGAYRSEVLDRVGSFNENLTRTEDNEYHYRIRKLGYTICYDPQILSYYQTRNSLHGMVRQKFLNGMWIGKTMWVCPKCLSLFHLVPSIFVMAVLLTVGIALAGLTWPLKTLWALYGSADIAMTALSIANEKKKSIALIMLPIVFLILHIAYGVGTLIGLFNR